MSFLFYIYVMPLLYMSCRPVIIIMPPRCYYYAILVKICHAAPAPVRLVFTKRSLSPSLPLSHFRAEFGSPVFVFANHLPISAIFAIPAHIFHICSRLLDFYQANP